METQNENTKRTFTRKEAAAVAVIGGVLAMVAAALFIAPPDTLGNLHREAEQLRYDAQTKELEVDLIQAKYALEEHLQGDFTQNRKSSKTTEVDLNRLAHCVAVAETNSCTKGIGPRTNNCFGLMTWERGYREPQNFATKEESYTAFKSLWERKYGGFPTLEQAKKYTGNDNPVTWLDNITACYNG